MHELYIAECIIKQARLALPRGSVEEDVSQLCVKVGQLDAVSAESLIFLFDAIKSSCGLAAARLLIEEESVRCRCRECRSDFSVQDPIFACPYCGATRVAVTQGRGITLMSISMKERHGVNEHTNHS
ncbi:hydrogenase maturation nickel metallochaperone HypA [bacterium]|nr:hydrogenase maturation nickel metallochaperone HypA [bacterium]